MAVFNALASHLHSVGVHMRAQDYNGTLKRNSSHARSAYSIASLAFASVMRSARTIIPLLVSWIVGGFTGEKL